MYKLCRIDLGRSEELYKEINKFASKLREKFKINRILLFGSFATGEINEGSDIDLVIVGDFKSPFFERIRKILSLTDLPIEPWIYTENEFNEMIRNKNPFILEVIETGKDL